MPINEAQAVRQLSSYEGIAAVDGVYVKDVGGRNLHIFAERKAHAPCPIFVFEYQWNGRTIDRFEALKFVRTFGESIR